MKEATAGLPNFRQILENASQFLARVNESCDSREFLPNWKANRSFRFQLWEQHHVADAFLAGSITHRRSMHMPLSPQDNASSLSLTRNKCGDRRDACPARSHSRPFAKFAGEMISL
jgi:hypothetical protein